MGLQTDPGDGVQVGLDPSVNWSTTASGLWVSDRLSAYRFMNNPTSDYEPFYFKAAGEMTAEDTTLYENIGEMEAVRMKLGSDEFRLDVDDMDILESRNQSSLSPTKRIEKKPRGNVIQHYFNEDILDDVGKEVLPEYSIRYFSEIPDFSIESYDKTPDGKIMRADQNDETAPNVPHHLAGMTSLQANGMKYVYGLPVMNHVQEEYTFSTDKTNADCRIVDVSTTTINGATKVDYDIADTDEFYNYSGTPKYASSYLLTSILGTDYIDITGDGPSDDDHGYWIKFNYVKSDNAYVWRAPFEGANFLRGAQSITSDDKGAFLYGERQQYYLATAETKTHIVEFQISQRYDARGANERYQNANSSNKVDAYSYKLDKIKIYSKLERYSPNAQPIKTIHFEYNYELCKDLPNNANSATATEDLYGNGPEPIGGKLTLKKLWFTYDNSNRGALSPYTFDYDAENTNSNPDYDTHSYDRWGNYQSYANGFDCESEVAPYTKQLDQETMDQWASSWSLKSIQLPSGASIDIQYEADDYAYVQDRTAMRMFKLMDVNDSNSSDNKITLNTARDPSNTDLRLYFDTDDEAEITSASDLVPYLEDIHGVRMDGTDLDFSESQISIKTAVDLNGRGDYEYVTSYAKVSDYGVDANGPYIELEPASLGNQFQKKNFHPISGAAWQYMKMHFPDKLSGKKLNENDDNVVKAIGSMLSAIGEIGALFKNFYQTCSDKGFGRHLMADESFIRLCDPDKKKYGGGSRVKKITLNDNWDVGEDGDNTNDDSSLGQVFEYTTLDEDGFEISSGVAINEPNIGYEECALRYAKEWAEEVLFRSTDNMLTEYPLNHSYFPGPRVGYSKVTVKSLATHYVLNPNEEETPSNLPDGFGTTGITVNEFYTAKDFPTLVQETELDDRIGWPKWVPIGVGVITRDFYTGSQGYSIQLNDMHGKPFKVTHYGQDKSGNIAEKINEVVYTYKTKSSEAFSSASNKRIAKVLDNRVDVLIEDPNNTDPGLMQLSKERKDLGLDYDFFMDMQEINSSSGNVDLQLNVSFQPSIPPIIVLTGFPGINLNEGQTRTVVTNKIIRQTGILERIDAYDGQSHIRTDNLVFDGMTGEPLLASVNNSFDDLIYNYGIPARLAYEGMANAYENWGLSFATSTKAADDCNRMDVYKFQLNSGSNDIFEKLIVGDEFIIDYSISGNIPVKTKGTLVEKSDPDLLYIHAEGIVDAVGDYNFLLSRSGKRNLLSAKAGNLSTWKNHPLEKESDPVSDNTTVKVPTSTSGSTNQSIAYKYQEIDSVLSASAVVFSDGWDQGVDSSVTNISGEENCQCLVIKEVISDPLGPSVDNCAGTISYLEDGSLVSVQVTISAIKNIIQSAGEYVLSCNSAGDISKIIQFVPDAPGSFGECNHISFDDQLRDCNESETGQGLEYTTIKDVVNPYSNGKKGIWRPQKSYVYVTDRSPLNPTATSNVDIRTEGTFDNLPLFNWKNPFFLQSSKGENWRFSEEITAFNPNSEEVENRNVIGIYNSALFGFNDNLAIAVGANARKSEIAFESFENFGDLSSGTEALSNLGDIPNKGNFDFFCSGDNQVVTETHNILGAYGGGSYIWTDRKYNTGDEKPTAATIYVQDKDGNTYTENLLINDIDGFLPSSVGLSTPLAGPLTVLTLGSSSFCEINSSDFYSGRIVLSYLENFNGAGSTTCNEIRLSADKAHTGQNSIYVFGNGAHAFEQKSLRLIKDRKYVMSGWVHVDGVEHYTFKDANNKIWMGINEDGGTPIKFEPEGQIIDGWQRIEGIFTYGGGELELEFESSSGKDAYFDDIRIYPQDGNIQTYVYRKSDYRLVAQLDNNNYATFYHYDEEGNLYLLKKETAKGIKTIQESKSFVKVGD